MSRLTRRTEDGRVYVPIQEKPDGDPEKIEEQAYQKTKEAFEKLARYEDLEEPDPETGLKPCRFCGGKKLVLTTSKGVQDCVNFGECNECGYYTVVCDFNKGGCGASSGYRATKKEAIEAWNRRATDDTI